MTVDPRFERSVHRGLRAYPPRWRRERADEVTALLADLADPGATRVDARTAVGLLRAGWATRLRTRPPLRYALAYRLLDRRVPARYRGWVRDDLEGEGSPVRVLVTVAVVAFLVSVVIPLVTGGRPHVPSAGSFGVMLGMLVGILARGPQITRKRAGKHLVPDVGEEVTSETLLFGWVLRDRLPARGTTGPLTLAVVITAGAALTACLLAPTALAAGSCGAACVETVSAGRAGMPAPLTAALAVALAAGVLGALRARALLDRLVPVRPAQHARRLVAPTPRHRMIVATATACLVGIAWLEGSGRTDLFFTVGIAVAALVALPGMVVASRTARTGPDDLALVDVLTIASTGRVPRVDTYQESLVPALLATD